MTVIWKSFSAGEGGAPTGMQLSALARRPAQPALTRGFRSTVAPCASVAPRNSCPEHARASPSCLSCVSHSLRDYMSRDVWQMCKHAALSRMAEKQQ